MTMRKRKEPKRQVQSRRVRPRAHEAARATEAVAAAEETEKLFDEPTTPAPSAVVPVEEPTARSKRGEEADICGSPDEARPDASDLH